MDVLAMKAFTQCITRPIPWGPVVITAGEMAIIVFVGSLLVATLAATLWLRWTRRF